MVDFSSTDSSKAPKHTTHEAAQGVRIAPGPFIGVVKNNVDPMRAGRLQIWISELGGDPEDSTAWRTVQYASPFFGVTPPPSTAANAENPSGEDRRTSGQSFENNPHSYGFWMCPPDLGVKVICTFINGDPFKGYWFACIPDWPNMHMVPAIAAGAVSDSAPGAPLVPVVEYNEQKEDVGKIAEFYNRQKTPHNIIRDQYIAQGLDKDKDRGPITSSSFRESPSQVFGFSTPGRALKQPNYGPNGDGEVNPNVIGRRGGHSFVMDDGDADGNSALVRLRTAAGHQIMMHDNTGFIYLITASGKSWIEMDAGGNINFYADGQFNAKSRGPMNFESMAGVKIKGTSVDISATNSAKVSGNGSLDLNSDGMTKVNGGKGLHLKGMNTYLTGDKCVQLNGGSHLDASAGCITLNGKQATKAQAAGNAAPPTAMPTKEPWNGHKRGGNAGSGLAVVYPGTASTGGVAGGYGAAGGYSGNNTSGGAVSGGTNYGGVTAAIGVGAERTYTGYLNNRAEIESYITQAATARGIDPGVALTVYRNEGLTNFQSLSNNGSGREPSYGPYQLLVGGPGTGYPAGMGNDFIRDTGLDPRDPKNIRQTIDYSLDKATGPRGWAPWYGARNAGISNRQGLVGSRPIGLSQGSLPSTRDITPTPPIRPSNEELGLATNNDDKGFVDPAVESAKREAERNAAGNIGNNTVTPTLVTPSLDIYGEPINVSQSQNVVTVSDKLLANNAAQIENLKSQRALIEEQRGFLTENEYANAIQGVDRKISEAEQKQTSFQNIRDQTATQLDNVVSDREDQLEGQRYIENTRLSQETTSEQTFIDDPDKVGPGAEYNNQFNKLNSDIAANNAQIARNNTALEIAETLSDGETRDTVTSRLTTANQTLEARNRELIDDRDAVQSNIDSTTVGTDFNNQQQGNYDPGSGLEYYDETGTDRDIDYNQRVINQIGETDLPDNTFADGTVTVVPDNGFDQAIDPSANYIDDVPTQTLDGTDFGKSDEQYRAESDYGLDRAIDPTSNYVDEQVYGPGGTIVPPSNATNPVTGGSTAPGSGGTGTPGAPTATKPAAPTSPAC